MDATLTKPLPKKRLVPITQAQYEQAKDRYLHGESAQTIADDFGCKRCALDTRFSRDGLPAQRLERLKDGRGDRIRAKLGQITENLADNLGRETPKSAIGLNMHADTAQKVAKTASLVFGWDDTVNLAIVVHGLLQGRRDDDDERVIDLPAVAQDGTSLAPASE